ncbi:methionyl-tRNA formyltransferase [Diaminobutyricimonas aerilata]|uniref:methionyl-tRNA formyltransferase n=1 Tax=Diaminobutyricimonas aerilata TaxID=1162967 RepID=UPI000C24C615|nr:methionyl-tRNA formyltransferase [Diaminobutyricimonas aerilata]
MRLVFAGSPAAAVPSLHALLASRHEVAAVLTREDSPQGRKRILTPTPVADVAAERGVRVVKANRLAPVTDELIALEPDLGVIVAYGGLVREPLLSAPRLGWINLHFSLLPRWRGAAPVQHALIAGDDVTGACVFQLVPELDAGDVFARMSRPVGRHETAGRLLDSLAVDGAELLARTVDALADGTAVAEPQSGEVTLAPKLTIADGRLDFGEPARRVIDRFRGVTPEPGAHTEVDGQRLKILDAAVAHDAPPLPAGRLALAAKRVLVGTPDGAVELVRVQPAGRTAMAAADWWRGLDADAEHVAA